MNALKILLIGMFLPVMAGAQTWPVKSVRVIVPYAPGGATDIVARILAPRFWAGVLVMPLLGAIFSAVGVLGGWLVGVVMIGVDAGSFWGQMQAGVNVWSDVGNGFIKTVVFGLTVSFIALRQGYEAQATPEGVSRATTRTVVMASLAVLALDFVLTALMFSL